MLRKRTIPSKPRFAFAVRRAYEVLADIGATTLPIDPFRISEHYPEIHIVSYTELKESTACADPFDFDRRNAQNAFLETLTNRSSNNRIDGETYKYRGDDEYLVVYDDRIGNEFRIRWTIAHELGHIFLGHFVEFTLTSFGYDAVKEMPFFSLLRKEVFGDKKFKDLTETEFNALKSLTDDCLSRLKTDTAKRDFWEHDMQIRQTRAEIRSKLLDIETYAPNIREKLNHIVQEIVDLGKRHYI